jgi:orotidine-5'-phosphate decarboxylase
VSGSLADKTQQALKRIVFPLDADRDQALAWARELGDLVGYFKVGLELFSYAGPKIIEDIKKIAPQAKIFLDLKLHDIPATVAGATKAVSDLGVDLLTVHAQGGSEMLAAAVAAAGSVKILGVTLLTSLEPRSLAELQPQFQEPGALALFLAQRALEAGAPGLVSSPLELKSLRARFGSQPLLVTPGIRPLWAQIPGDDQKRVGSPQEALLDGADLLVIGRPIAKAPDRRQAALKVAEEILS